MKIKNATLNVAAAGLVAALIAGCTTSTIPVTMNVAGEVKLNGVSKIALADFNSLKGDEFTGVMAADEETCALVKRAVASAFYTSPMYKIVDMDIEKSIHDTADAKPGKRFDAVIYGRLWWQITPVTKGVYPRVYTLNAWDKVQYMKKDPITRRNIPAVKPVMKESKDVMAMLDYQAQNATLMLTLSIYRLEQSGDIVKIADTYQVSNQGFTLMDGEMKLEDASVGIQDDNAVTRLQNTDKGSWWSFSQNKVDNKKTTTAYDEMFNERFLRTVHVRKVDPTAKKLERKVDANGKLILTQETVSMPTELQAKLMLASSVASSLSAKLAPSKATFDVPADFGDDRLENLIKEGAFKSAKAYSMYMLRQMMGKQICAHLVSFLPELGDPCSYLIPDSGTLVKDYNELLKSEDKMMDYLASKDLDEYFYALGISCEAAQELDVAQEYYRFAFKVNPCEAYALGISRTYLAMGESGRLQQTKKAQKKAEKKAAID